jgi:murein DD-endopeptidase MepM/ murein hydrolase activator NlpD
MENQAIAIAKKIKRKLIRSRKRLITVIVFQSLSLFLILFLLFKFHSDAKTLNSDIASLKEENDKLRKEIYNYKKLEKFFPLGSPVKEYFITSDFGLRNDPIDSIVIFHPGIDIVSNIDSIFSTSDGVVKFSGVNGGYGNCIIIELESKIETLYAHLNSMAVNKGDVVKRGQYIGIIGTTGRSTGKHLHYEIIMQNIKINPIYFLEF